MVVPFGISIGDFVAVGTLAHKIAVALNDTRGAAAEYRSLIKLLESLITCTQQITNFVSSSAACATLRIDQALANGLMYHAQRCQRLMVEFLADSQKYTQSMINGQGSRAKGIARKLKWKLYNSEDAQKLEVRLNSHLQAFQTYLSAINIQFEAESTNRLESKMHQISYSLSEIHTFVITQQNKPRALGYPWEADPTSSHIQMEDILGRKLVLPLALCHNMQTFHDTLKVLFADHPGYQKIVKREFEIIDQDNGIVFGGSTSRKRVQDDLRSPPLSTMTVRPGARLEMNILISMKKEAPRDAMIIPSLNINHALNVDFPALVSVSGNGKTPDPFSSGFCTNCDTTFRQTIKEYAGPNLEFPERWPEKIFNLKDTHQSPERSIREVDATSPESILVCGESIDVSLDSDWEQKHFRRVHYVTEYEVRASYMANQFDNSRFPLIQAAGQGNARWVQDLLLNYDMDPNMRSFQGWTALQQACSAKQGRPAAVVKMLIKHGAEVNAAPGDGYALTALQAACKIGNEELVDILLEYGADIHATPAPYGETALTAASSGRHITIVDRLLKLGADVNQQAPHRLNAVEIAAQSGNLELIERFVQEGADVYGESGTGALKIAVQWDQYDVAKQLLELGAEVNFTAEGLNNIQSGAPIHWFSNSRMLELLLHHGAGINQPASKYGGTTALQHLAAHGSTALMEKLIEKGADVHAPGSETRGLTALQAAASLGNLANVKTLVEKYGANLNELRSAREGYTTLEAACCQIAKAPYRFLPNLPKEDRDNEPDRLELIEYLLDRGASITPFTLHIAAAWGDLPLTRLLLHRGARIRDPPDNQFINASWGDDRALGQTALETAILNNRREVAEFLQARSAGQGDMIKAVL